MDNSEGLRFSQNYLRRGEPVRDSARMRRRLLRAFCDGQSINVISAAQVEAETGTVIPWTGYGHNWEVYFGNCELRDLLDTITLVARGLNTADRQYWIESTARIFREENAGYRIDNKGGVHFAVDSEFSSNQASAIAALQGPRYGAALDHFEAAQNALDATPMRTRDAIRQTFEAVETVFRLMFPDASNLGSADAARKLQPLLLKLPNGTERDSSLRLLASFKEWINSAHNYRHGQGVEEPDNPSLQLTVLSVSGGAGFLRWLAELDTAARAD